MPTVTPEELAGALSPQDLMARINALALPRVPSPKAPAGRQRLGLNFNDPLPGFGGDSSLQSADPLTLTALFGQGILAPTRPPQGDPLAAAAELGMPKVLRDDYKGPQTGSQAGDILAGLGDIFNAGSFGPGAATPLAAKALGATGSSMGSFGGQSARFADLRKLDAAQGLEAVGAPSKDILQQTGWFKDVDGHWKFEISDQLAKLTPKAEDLIGSANRLQKGQAGVGKLGDFVSNPELQLNYPQLFDTKTAFVGNPLGEFGPRAPGSFTPAWVTELGQNVPAKIGVSANTPEGALSTLVHEPEHGVQFTEGFAPGASPVELAREMYGTTTTGFLDKKKEILAALAKEPSLAGLPIKTDRFTHPADVPSLIEALAMDRPSRREMKSFINWFDSRPEDFRKELLPLVKPWLKNFLDLGSYPQPEDAFEYYFGHLGEANARAASLRQPWTKQQRLDTPVEATRRADPNVSSLPGYITDFDPAIPLAEQIRPPR